MEEMQSHFIPRLNEFSELMRTVNRLHGKHIVETGEQIKQLKHQFEMNAKEIYLNHPVGDNKELKEEYQLFLQKTKELQDHFKAFRVIFQNHVNDTNFQLGMFSTFWGSYIEQKGVEYMLQSLRRDYQVHTWYQKFKKYWHKSRNFEIDLLALSDTHAYLIEVKNQLKKEVIHQVLTNLEKLREQAPEYNHLQKQVIIMCCHAEDDVVNTLVWGNIWIMRYTGFDTNKTEESWEWIRKT